MKNSKMWLLGTILLFSSVASGQIPVPLNLPKYIVSFRPGTPQSVRMTVLQQAGARVRFNYAVIDAAAVSVLDAAVLSILQSNPLVTGIVPDRTIFAIQNPPRRRPMTRRQVLPAGVRRVGSPTATSHGEGIGVAIMDTGIDLRHRDLSPSPRSFSAFGRSCQDDHGHGTHVTGIATALDNTIDVIGVAPRATPYCVKVLTLLGTGSDSTIIAGLDWIFQNYALVTPRIRVVNMSLGRPGSLNDSPPFRQAIQALYSRDIAIIVAAGNDPEREADQMVPATYPEVFAIASTSAVNGSNACILLNGVVPADTASFFTTDGRFDPNTRIGVTISAPGEEREDVNVLCSISTLGILSTRLGGGTTRMSGTSMAAPHVAGVVARLMQAENMAGVENIRSYLRARADRLGTVPFDSPAASYSFDGEREGIGQIQ
jgi:subtilisin family serine protease